MTLTTLQEILPELAAAVPAIAAAADACAECGRPAAGSAVRCTECGGPICQACADGATADGHVPPVCMPCDLRAIAAADDDELAAAAGWIERTGFVGRLMGVA